ncbi:superoxide dismutase [Bacillus atrophaeus]|uniref:superoxide dismutase n=1 Tax=Bacillus atrophaeus TaxID=1452 RepID=UPI003F5AB71A
MKRHTYQTEMINWCEDLKEQVQKRGQYNHFEAQFKKVLDKLEDEQATEEEWYREAAALYRDITEAGGTSERKTYVPIGKHVLPKLPYKYSALEPYISREIMTLHHTKHHQSYVDGLNKAELELKKARQTKNYELVAHWERELAFHGAGHYLHSIFWFSMHPNGKRRPTGALFQMIDLSFGSYSAFKEHFTQAAKKVEGVGWAILVWSPRSGRLEILAAEKHQLFSQWDVIPLLPLDVWEHAYYLQYKNERAKYVDNWWNVVDWREAEKRFEKARNVVWQLY